MPFEQNVKLKNLMAKLVSLVPFEDEIAEIEIEPEIIELAEFVQSITNTRSGKSIQDNLGMSGWLGARANRG